MNQPTPPSSTPFADSHFTDLVKERDQLRAEKAIAQAIAGELTTCADALALAESLAKVSIENDQLKSTLAQREVQLKSALDAENNWHAMYTAEKALVDKTGAELAQANAKFESAYNGAWVSKRLVNLEEMESELSALRKDKESAIDLIAHIWIHSAYKMCGFWEMSTKQKEALIDALKESHMPDSADSLRTAIDTASQGTK